MRRNHPGSGLSVVIKGNHDEQASLLEPSRGFNELAEHAINWTRENLTEEDKEWLRELRLLRQVRDFTIVHATLDTPGALGLRLQRSRCRQQSHVSTHLRFVSSAIPIGPVVFVRDDNVRRMQVQQIAIDPAKKYFINAGASVSRAMAIGAPPIAFSIPSETWSSNGGSNTMSKPRRRRFAGRPAAIACRSTRDRSLISEIDSHHQAEFVRRHCPHAARRRRHS